MASSAQFSIGSTAQAVVSAPVIPGHGPVGWFSLANGSGGSVYLGGPNVGSGNGYSVAASTTFSAYLFSGDVVYAVQNSGASTISVFVSGA